MKVFVVEDSASIRDLIRMSVEDAGGSVIGEATRKVEAITLIGVLNPDVVIIDLSLPDGSGIDVMKTAKKDHPGIRMIVLTNHERAQFEQVCLASGADYYFEKSASDYQHFKTLLLELNLAKPSIKEKQA